MQRANPIFLTSFDQGKAFPMPLAQPKLSLAAAGLTTALLTKHAPWSWQSPGHTAYLPSAQLLASCFIFLSFSLQLGQVVMVTVPISQGS